MNYETEDQIECAVERKVDRLDRLYMAGDVDHDEYERRMRHIHAWAEEKTRLLPTKKPITPEGNKVTYWPCEIGDRVTYAVSSGFCTQVYAGVVTELRRDQALVLFDATPRSPNGWSEWIDEQYLTIVSPLG